MPEPLQTPSFLKLQVKVRLVYGRTTDDGGAYIGGYFEHPTLDTIVPRAK